MQFIKKETKEEEIKNLEKQLQKNEEDIRALIDKMKYLDINLIEIVNNELRKLQQGNEK